MRGAHISGNFRNLILRAGAWTLGGHIAIQGLRLGSNLIMTRLLVPEMFGVMVLANVIMIGLALFSDIGLSQAVVQSRRGNDTCYLNTVWTLQICRGVLIWLVALALGVLIYVLGSWKWLPPDSAYDAPMLPYIIGVLSFNAVFSGFASTRLFTASRNLALGRLTLIEVSSQFVAMLAMICWAVVDRSIWALVAGSLLASMLRVVLSHTMLPGERNFLCWNRECIKEILGFGKWIFLTSILGFLSANGDRLLLGAYVSAATLGLYSIALFFVNALQEIFSKLGGSVAFPALCQVVRERPWAIKEVYYKFRLPLDVATLLATGLLFSSGHLLISVLYDARYQTAGHMIEVLCIGLFEARFALAGQCFVALGMPKLLAPVIFIRIVAVFGLVPIAFHLWGFEGALWITGGSVLFTLPLTLYFKVKHGLFDMKHELKVLPVLLGGYLLGTIINQIAVLAGLTK